MNAAINKHASEVSPILTETSNLTPKNNIKVQTKKVDNKTTTKVLNKKELKKQLNLENLKMSAQKLSDKIDQIPKKISSIKKEIYLKNIKFKRSLLLAISQMDKQKKKILQSINETKSIELTQQRLKKIEEKFPKTIVLMAQQNEKFNTRKLQSIDKETKIIDSINRRYESLQYKLTDYNKNNRNNKMKFA